MIKNSIEQLAESIGFDIGASDNETQAKLLNGFCRGLSNSIPGKRDQDMQFCYIAEKLNDNTERVLTGLLEFIALKQEGGVND